MEKMTQKEAVYRAITAVIGTIEGIVTLTLEQKKNVYTLVTEGFAQGMIALADTPSNQTKLEDDSEMKDYVQGLVSNWMRKDARLNGGIRYEAKNPGSRTGSGDEKLRALREVRKAVSGDATKLGLVDTAIEKRIRELAAEKVKKLDTSKIDPELVEALGIK